MESSDAESQNFSHGSFCCLKLSEFPPSDEISSYSSLDFSSNPIKSFKGLPILPLLENLTIDDTNIDSFIGVWRQPSLVSISIRGTPLAKNTLSRIMIIVAFGFWVKEIDGQPVSKEETDLAQKLSPRLHPLLDKGWLLTSINPNTVTHYQTRKSGLLDEISENESSETEDKCNKKNKSSENIQNELNENESQDFVSYQNISVFNAEKYANVNKNPKKTGKSSVYDLSNQQPPESSYVDIDAFAKESVASRFIPLDVNDMDSYQNSFSSSVRDGSTVFNQVEVNFSSSDYSSDENVQNINEVKTKNVLSVQEPVETMIYNEEALLATPLQIPIEVNLCFSHMVALEAPLFEKNLAISKPIFSITENTGGTFDTQSYTSIGMKSLSIGIQEQNSVDIKNAEKEESSKAKETHRKAPDLPIPNIAPILEKANEKATQGIMNGSTITPNEEQKKDVQPNEPVEILSSESGKKNASEGKIKRKRRSSHSHSGSDKSDSGSHSVKSSHSHSGSDKSDSGSHSVKSSHSRKSLKDKEESENSQHVHHHHRHSAHHSSHNRVTSEPRTVDPSEHHHSRRSSHVSSDSLPKEMDSGSRNEHRHHNSSERVRRSHRLRDEEKTLEEAAIDLSKPKKKKVRMTSSEVDNQSLGMLRDDIVSSNHKRSDKNAKAKAVNDNQKSARLAVNMFDDLLSIGNDSLQIESAQPRRTLYKPRKRNIERKLKLDASKTIDPLDVSPRKMNRRVAQPAFINIPLYEADDFPYAESSPIKVTSKSRKPETSSSGYKTKDSMDIESFKLMF